MGVLLDNGEEWIFVKGDEADLTDKEFSLLRNSWFCEVQCVGPAMSLEGTLVLCKECKEFWRRPVGMGNVRTSAECAEEVGSPKLKYIHATSSP